MNDLIKQFMSSMELPQQYGSTESKNVYHVIAEKDGAKLGVSAMVAGAVAIGKKPVVALVLRFIEIPAHGGDQPVFTGFEVRTKSEFKDFSNDGAKVGGFRGEKHTIPITHAPVTGYDFLKMLEQNNTLDEVKDFIKDRVKLAGGEMTVSDVTFRQILQHQMEEIPHEAPEYLFKLPVIKGYNDQPPAGSGDESQQPNQPKE